MMAMLNHFRSYSPARRSPVSGTSKLILFSNSKTPGPKVPKVSTPTGTNSATFEIASYFLPLHALLPHQDLELNTLCWNRPQYLRKQHPIQFIYLFMLARGFSFFQGKVFYQSEIGRATRKIQSGFQFAPAFFVYCNLGEKTNNKRWQELISHIDTTNLLEHRADYSN